MHKKRILLTFGALTGLGLTIVTTVQATVEAVELLDHEKEIGFGAISREDAIRTVLPVTIKPAIFAGLTVLDIICLSISYRNTINSANALAAKLASTIDIFNSYRNVIANTYGEDVEKAIYISVDGGFVEKHIMEDPEKILVVDDFLKIPYETTYEKLLSAMYSVNRKFATNANVSLADFYNYLDFSQENSLAEKFGWSMDLSDELCYLPWIDIDVEETNDDYGNEYYILSYTTEPMFGFNMF